MRPLPRDGSPIERWFWTASRHTVRLSSLPGVLLCNLLVHLLPPFLLLCRLNDGNAGLIMLHLDGGRGQDLATAAPAPAFSVSAARRLLADGPAGLGLQVQLLINGTRDAVKSAQQKLQSSVDSGAFLDGLKKGGASLFFLRLLFHSCCFSSLPAALLSFLLSLFHFCCSSSLPAAPLSFLLLHFLVLLLLLPSCCCSFIPAAPLPFQMLLRFFASSPFFCPVFLRLSASRCPSCFHKSSAFAVPLTLRKLPFQQVFRLYTSPTLQQPFSPSCPLHCSMSPVLRQIHSHLALLFAPLLASI